MRLIALAMFWHGDLQEALGQRLGVVARPVACAHLRGQRVEALRHAVAVQRLVAPGRTPWEMRRLDLAQQHVGVGHRQRAAAAVAGRAGVGAGAFRPDAQARAVERSRIEPPPAATVWMLIIGARMRTPATWVSNARSNSPA
jgi:hypothetical protein